MRRFTIVFSFRNALFEANVTQIDPPPDLQWHIFPTDHALVKEFGDSFIILWNEKEQQYNYGFPPIFEGMEFMHSLAKSLNGYIYAHGLSARLPGYK